MDYICGRNRPHTPMESTAPQTEFVRFTTKSLLGWGIVVLLYCLLVINLVGFRWDQLLLILVCVGSYFGNAATRKFFLSMALFAIYWVVFDSMKAYPNYLFRDVNIEQLYLFEKSLFGLDLGGKTVTLNEYFNSLSIPFLDVLCGLFYLCWVPVPMLFTGYLYWKDKRYLVYFASCFILLNILGFSIWYLYPAAPPWYVAEHGFVEKFAVPGSSAGLAKFDQFFGISLFAGIYEKSSNVFAAIPSLHSAYPVLLVGFAWILKWRRALIGFSTIMLGIWFAAIYTSHHYTVDVILGAFCGLTALLLFWKLVLKWGPLKRAMDRYVKLL